MYQYANGFACAMDKDQKEVLIKFLQHSPGIGPDNQIEGVKNEEIAALVMNRDVALHLTEVLRQMLEGQAPKNIYPIK